MTELTQYKDNPTKIIKLNVGGKKFSTTAYTLTKIPDTFFTSLFSGKFKLDCDDEGCIFIDRNGSKFEVVLEYIRTGQLSVPPKYTKDDILVEAEFYLIESLIELCKPPIEEEQEENMLYGKLFSRHGYYQVESLQELAPFQVLSFGKEEGKAVTADSLGALHFIRTLPSSLWDKTAYANAIIRHARRSVYKREVNNIILHYDQQMNGVPGHMSKDGNIHILTYQNVFITYKFVPLE